MSATAKVLTSAQTTQTERLTDRWPRIALVTPVFNSAKYVEPTIRSVLVQDYPNLDYFIVDGGSTDGTIDIIRKYENQISGWVSGPDNGMYDAINKGFARTTGEIMGWISATDMLHVGGLSVVGSVFRDLPEVEWITGLPTYFNEEGMIIGTGGVQHWSRYRFLAGANRTIQQESTFWRRSLWESAGGRMDDSRRSSSDFELWVRFFRHARLYPVEALIGGFRLHEDSLGWRDMEACYKIHDEIVEAELNREPWGKQLRWFRRFGAAAKSTRLVREVWRYHVERRLYQRPGSDWPPVIQYATKDRKWVVHGK
jgi:glycosyltransferase involved in cell wall biosynthesis